MKALSIVLGPALGAAVLTASVLTFLLPAPAHAEDGAWQYEATLYGIGAGMDGKVAVHGVEADVDVSFSDVLANLQLGFMGNFQAKKARWGYAIDGIYMGLGGSKTFATGARADVDVNEFLLEGDASYELRPGVDLVFGGRLVHLNSKLKLEGAILDLATEDSENWIDPVVGLRFRAPLTKRLSFFGRGDIGGFGVGSDFTWQGILGADVKLTKRMSLLAGWRWIDIDYESGSGSSKFVYDVLTQGPGGGLTFSF